MSERKFISFILEILRIVVLLTVGLGLLLYFQIWVYGLLNIDMLRMDFSWMPSIASILLIFVLYRNVLQLTGWFNSTKNIPLSHKCTSLLVLISLSLLIFPIFYAKVVFTPERIAGILLEQQMDGYLIISEGDQEKVEQAIKDLKVALDYPGVLRYNFDTNIFINPFTTLSIMVHRDAITAEGYNQMIIRFHALEYNQQGVEEWNTYAVEKHKHALIYVLYDKKPFQKPKIINIQTKPLDTNSSFNFQPLL